MIIYVFIDAHYLHLFINCERLLGSVCPETISAPIAYFFCLCYLYRQNGGQKLGIYVTQHILKIGAPL